MKVIPDETIDLLEALLFTIRKIVESGAQGKQSIANAYYDACSLVVTIERDGGSAGPRIETCLKHFNIHKDAGDVASAGWMLAAIEQRVSERNLYGWRKLEEIVNAAVHELLLSAQASPH